MAEKRERRSSVMINPAPVLTVWAAVVAEMLSFDYDEALTLGRQLQGSMLTQKALLWGFFNQRPRLSESNVKSCEEMKW
jgi:hypothetical protein